MDYKTILGITAVVIGFVSYIPYIKDIFYGDTKPHVFSWLGWAVIQGTGSLAQISRGGGSGAWVTGTTAIMCFSVFIISLSKGEKNITILDKASFTAALLGILLWGITKNPLTAVVLVSIADFLVFLPTFRKAYSKPYEEATTIYALYVLVWFLSLLALRSYNLTTVLYPASLFLTNAAFVIMSFSRKKIPHE